MDTWSDVEDNSHWNVFTEPLPSSGRLRGSAMAALFRLLGVML
jgi:hypothetical protein